MDSYAITQLTDNKSLYSCLAHSEIHSTCPCLCCKRLSILNFANSNGDKRKGSDAGIVAPIHRIIYYFFPENQHVSKTKHTNLHVTTLRRIDDYKLTQLFKKIIIRKTLVTYL